MFIYKPKLLQYMKRKVVKHGQNTLTVSLPSKWCRAHGIKQGDEIEVEEKGPLIQLSPLEVKRKTETSLDFSNIDISETRVLRNLINHTYKK